MQSLDPILTRRSMRRYQEKPVPLEQLQTLADAGRMAASGGNRQPWAFVIVRQKELVDAIFACLSWLAGDGNPENGMKPIAYIVILGDPRRSSHWQLDCAAAAQNILVAANALGLGSCWLGSVRWDTVRKALNVPQHLEGFGVISLGYSAQEVVIEEREGRLPQRDEAGILHLPKRHRDEIVHLNGYRDLPLHASGFHLRCQHPQPQSDSSPGYQPNRRPTSPTSEEHEHESHTFDPVGGQLGHRRLPRL